MTDSDLEEKLARNREDRYRQIREWAEYVRTHPDEEWGRQVNTVVDAQLQSARHFQDERPDLDQRRDRERREARAERDVEAESDDAPPDSGDDSTP